MGKKKKENKTIIKKKVMELLYMAVDEITAQRLKESISEKDNMRIEFWEDMNILQLELKNGGSVDFEPMNGEFTEDSDRVFIKNRNVKTIFYITIQEDDFEEMRPVFREILLNLGGFICADSHNFQPIYTEDKL